MKITAFVSHSDCSRHDPGWKHPEHQGRLPAVARAVYRDMLTLFEPLLELEARPATMADLRLAHTDEYLARIQRRVREAGERGGALELDGEVVVSGASWEASVAAVGSALTAVEAVLDGTVRNAFCATRPPGHGAGPDAPGGFGLLNQTAIAARHLRERHGLARVLIAEWGARAGRGTAAVVASDPGIRFLTVHQSPADAAPWPEGVRTAELPAGAGGADLLGALSRALDAALAEFAPEFILLSLGCDALAADPLGGLALKPLDYYALTRELRARADDLCSGRLVSVLEDGYHPEATGRAVVQHLRALAGLPPAESAEVRST